MGFLLAHRRKLCFSVCIAMLFIVYLFSVWFNLKFAWVHKNVCKLPSNLNKQVKVKYSKDMQDRKRYIHQRCDAVDLILKTKPQLFLSSKLQLVHCGLFGSELEVLFPAALHSNPLSQSFYEESDNTVECYSQNFKTVLVVQHPVEMLMKIFLDKTLLQYHFKQHSSHSSIDVASSRNVSVLFPTFQDLLLQILKMNGSVYAWSSLSEKCHLCKVDFDFVIFQSESLEDFQHLLQEFDLELNSYAANAYKYSYTKLNKHVSDFYADSANKNILKNVENFYKNDFKLFDFSKTYQLT